MRISARSLGRVVLSLIFAILTPFLHAAEKQRVQVDNYVIQAIVMPQIHQLKAVAQVKFTALDDISIASFQLHNGLRVTGVFDAEGQTLSAERISQDASIRVSLPTGLSKGAASTLIFEYEGTVQSADDSPVPGLKLAYVGDPMTYLLYAGAWFPMVGYGTDRFTSTIGISAPSEYTVIGSGKETTGAMPVIGEDVEAPQAGAKKPGARSGPGKLAVPAGYSTRTFTYSRASFPGTILIGKYDQTKISEGGLDVTVYTSAQNKQFAQAYADTASKEFFFYTSSFGPAFSTKLNVVEIPNDTVPSAWAPEIAAITSRAFTAKVSYRLLANNIAHQWWGTMVSPATRNDWWISDGFARYSEAMYVEHVAGQAGFEEVTKDMAVGALAYISVPLSQVGKLDVFSPEFQSLVTDKGGSILNMLRWVIGDQAFDKTMRNFLAQYAGKPATVNDLEKVAEQASGQQLSWFFVQWLDSTGAPEFKTKYTIYRTQKGFRVVGEIQQDLDLFRMPVELRIDTDGKTETKRIEVSGTDSAFAVETFGKPRKISVDPNNRVLKNSPELQVRTSIVRGQQDVEQGDLTEALKEFQKALDVNKNSSLAHYRIAEVFFLQHNYQSAANAYRESLNGDGEPRWTEVWSHVQLGKIFDLTGQRERASNEYRQALQTNDNTAGALDEARKYLQAPFTPQSAPSGTQ
ncbi:MAG TPA: M1 family aminopeptidase [Candidatus Eisenbacteria bacterium]|nr:M1 family aminopeptidase [Candidatus Eisenbacteria bacterium]